MASSGSTVFANSVISIFFFDILSLNIVSGEVLTMPVTNRIQIPVVSDHAGISDVACSYRK